MSLLYSASSSVQEAAQEALMSAGSYNHDVKLAYLKCLVHDLREGNKDGLVRLDQLVSTMEIRDYAAVVLDQAILPIVSLLKDDDQKLNAVTVLGTISEERPAAGVRSSIRMHIRQTHKRYLCTALMVLASMAF